MPSVSVADYKRRQERVAARVGAHALPLVRPMVGERLTESDVRTFSSQIFDRLTKGRERSARLARDFYMSERDEHVGEVLDELQAPPDPYSVRDLTTGLLYFMRPGDKFDNVASAVDTVSRHVKSGARREVAGLSLADARSGGWARTSGGTTSCSFCLMLISRGPVYRSRESAGDMKKFHNRCDCVVVPVFNKRKFPGIDEWRSAESLWNSSTRGKSGPAALKAFRSAITSSAPGGLDAAAA